MIYTKETYFFQKKQTWALRVSELCVFLHLKSVNYEDTHICCVVGIVLVFELCQ